MPLKDHRLTVLISGCSRLFDDDIVYLVLGNLQAPLFRKCDTLVTDPFCVKGGVRNFAQLFKEMKYLFWLKIV